MGVSTGIVELPQREQLTMIVLRILAIAVLVLLAPLFVLLAIPILVWLGISRLWFQVWNHGKTYLVYSRRHGWNEFVINNLHHVLHGATIVEQPRGHRRRWPRIVYMLNGYGLPKPFLVKVRWFGSRRIPLHALLLPFKSCGAKNETVQLQLRELLRTVLSDY
jgi:hypothetical protein